MEIYQRLAAKHPKIFESKVAMTLRNLEILHKRVAENAANQGLSVKQILQGKKNRRGRYGRIIAVSLAIIIITTLIIWWTLK